MSDARTAENIGGGVEFYSASGAEGARDKSYPLTVGMVGAKEG